MAHGSSIRRSPWWCRTSVATAALLVPSRLRPDWRQRWHSASRNWWTLVERGELTTRSGARFCLAAFDDAFHRRFRRDEWREFSRGPAFVILLTLAAAALLTLVSQGFSVTRSLVAALNRPTVTYVYHRPYDPAGDRLVAYFIPIFTALASALCVAVAARGHLRSFGWRHAAFLLFKTVAAVLILPFAFIELGAIFRSFMPNEGFRVLVGGIGATVVYIAAQGAAIYWCLADQRRRCPVCLRRMTMPVAIGSWASIFDPASTELLCEEGHGALCVVEAESGGVDRWLELDSSWRDLFENHPAKP